MKSNQISLGVANKTKQNKDFYRIYGEAKTEPLSKPTREVKNVAVVNH